MPPSPERAATEGVRAAVVFTQPRGAVLAQLVERVDERRLRIVVGKELRSLTQPKRTAGARPARREEDDPSRRRTWWLMSGAAEGQRRARA